MYLDCPENRNGNHVAAPFEHNLVCSKEQNPSLLQEQNLCSVSACSDKVAACHFLKLGFFCILGINLIQQVIDLSGPFSF